VLAARGRCVLSDCARTPRCARAPAKLGAHISRECRHQRRTGLFFSMHFVASLCLNRPNHSRVFACRILLLCRQTGDAGGGRGVGCRCILPDSWLRTRPPYQWSIFRVGEIEVLSERADFEFKIENTCVRASFFADALCLVFAAFTFRCYSKKRSALHALHQLYKISRISPFGLCFFSHDQIGLLETRPRVRLRDFFANIKFQHCRHSNYTQFYHCSFDRYVRCFPSKTASRSPASRCSEGTPRFSPRRLSDCQTSITSTGTAPRTGTRTHTSRRHSGETLPRSLYQL
jgi:hypothetical protein